MASSQTTAACTVSSVPLGSARPYYPALDGLRALCVLAIMLYHAQTAWLPGGFLGVEVFFVVSGFLITSLLRQEHESSGRVDFVGFLARRARRLLPALYALLLGVMLYVALVLPGELYSLRKEAAAGLGYVTNWYLVWENKSYFDQIGRPSLLMHLWSLAVEEQFYVLWPLVYGLLLARFRARTAGLLTLLLAAASAFWMNDLFVPDADPSRVYYGSDTRAAGLLVGAALALLLPARGKEPLAERGRTADLLGLLGLGALGAAAYFVLESDDAPYQGALLLVDGFAALAIVGALHPTARVLRMVLGNPVLRYIGTRSYGLYLWHWPVFALTRPDLDLTLPMLPHLAVRFGLSFLLAELSYRLVEAPARAGVIGRAWRALGEPRGQRAPGVFAGWTLGAPAVGLLVGFVAVRAFFATAPAPEAAWAFGGPDGISAEDIEADAALQSAYAASTNVSSINVAPRLRSEVGLREAPIDATGPRADDAKERQPSAVRTVQREERFVPVRATPPDVLAIGDSVMLGAASYLRRSSLDVEVDARVGRNVIDAVKRLTERKAAGQLGRVVILHLGNNGWFRSRHFDQLMEILREVPRVIFVTNRVPRHWQDINNGTILEGVSRHSRAMLVDWVQISASHPEWFGVDGLHLRPPGAMAYADLLRNLMNP